MAWLKSNKSESQQNCLERICVSLASRAAEVPVFGESASTTGSESGFKSAAALAAQYVRYYGFGQRLSRIDVTHDSEEHLNTDVQPTNDDIESMMAQVYARAQDLLRANAQLLRSIVGELIAHDQIAKKIWLNC